MSILPKEIDYASKLNSLPSNTSCLSAVISPSNGQSFIGGDQVIIAFDLPARGFMVPGSLYLRYKNTITNPNGGTADVLLGTPFATPFSRLEVLIGSQSVESLQQYNQMYNMIVNSKLNHAQKAGMAVGFGLLDNTSTISYDNLNGRAIPAAAGVSVVSVAAPLGCILSNCQTLVPLCMMPQTRIQLTTESITKMFAGLAATGISTVTGYVLSNLELCCDIINFGPEVENMCRSMADEGGNLTIKSQSFSSSSQNIAAGTTGQIELVYNQRISSIKSVFALFSPPFNSKLFGSRDITKNAGDYQFLIASEAYPPRPLSSLTNKSGMLMELLAAWGPTHDMTTNNCHITPVEWNRVDGTTDTSVSPGKFIVACNVEKLSTSGNLLTGVSSQLSPISLRINMPSGLSDVTQATLITCYDALLQVNVDTRQATVKI